VEKFIEMIRITKKLENDLIKLANNFLESLKIESANEFY